ncbi:MAG TPA: tetratricopeptide repeat protein [Pseudobdellovibrionaceae bacterium]|nr:tetratricopeptide repeat protein [Pseudobdellovibrionaceae bacterium]
MVKFISSLALAIFLLGSSLSCSKGFKADDTCSPRVAQGEDQMDDQKWAEAEATLLQALDHCRKVRQGGTYPSMTLATLYFRQRRYADAVPHFEAAIQLDPQLALAHVNLSASLLEAKRYDECIRSAQRGLKILQHQPGAEASKGKLNFNIGLAIYDKFADQQPRRVRQAEPYLKEASRLLPDFGGADFLLGTIAEVIHEDADLARSHFSKACDRGDKSACTASRRPTN